MSKVLFLEPAARAFAEAGFQRPFLCELGHDAARKVLHDLQAAPIAMPAVTEKWITVPTVARNVPVRVIKPVDATGLLPAILYMHGGGWVLGDARTHDRLVRELAVGVRAAVVFVEYDRSPEIEYPVALEQGYATARWITEHGRSEGLDATRLAVAGDSVGGNMTAALAILAGHAQTSRSSTSRCITRSPSRTGHRQLSRVRRRPVPHREVHGVVLGLLPPKHITRACARPACVTTGHARLHDAQRAARHGSSDRRNRAGDPRLAQRARHLKQVAADAPASPSVRRTALSAEGPTSGEPTRFPVPAVNRGRRTEMVGEKC